MRIEKFGVAGSLESSDAQVMIAPNENGIELEIESSVYYQYGKQIRKLAEEVIANLGIEQATVKIQDSGALDCTIKARIESAYYRAVGQNKNIPWEAL